MARLPNSTPKRSRLRLLEIAPRGTLGDGHEPTVGDGGDVPLNILVPAGQTVDAFQITTPAGSVLYSVGLDGNFAQGGVPGVRQCVAQVALTAAQITTLHTVPVSLIAAPGAGFAIMVDAMVFDFAYGSVQFTGGGATSAVFHGATANLLGGSVAAVTIQAAANAVISAGAPAAALALSTNTGVDLYAASADFAAGDSTAVVTIWYSIIAV